MNEELEKRYKAVMARYNTPGPGWFSVPVGWLSLIEELADGLDDVLPDWSASQVKTKFGSLRVYLIQSSQEAEELIRVAEAAADQTCNICGANGEYVSMSVRCEEHRDSQLSWIS